MFFRLSDKNQIFVHVFVFFQFPFVFSWNDKIHLLIRFFFFFLINTISDFLTGIA